MIRGMPVVLCSKDTCQLTAQLPRPYRCSCVELRDHEATDDDLELAELLFMPCFVSLKRLPIKIDIKLALNISNFPSGQFGGQQGWLLSLSQDLASPKHHDYGAEVQCLLHREITLPPCSVSQHPIGRVVGDIRETGKGPRAPRREEVQHARARGAVSNPFALPHSSSIHLAIPILDSLPCRAYCR